MAPFHGIGGLNMYLDTASQNVSPPVSSATLSPPTTPLTPEPTMSSTQFPLLTDSNQVNMNASAASTLFLQRQYQYHLLLQQQQQQLALAKHQLALAASAAAANHQQKDEIAHSLKMFALLTACNTGECEWDRYRWEGTVQSQSSKESTFNGNNGTFMLKFADSKKMALINVMPLPR